MITQWEIIINFITKANTMNPVLKKKLSILIHLAVADGEFARIEKNFIEEICTRNNISRAEREQLFRNPEPIGTLGALSYPKAIEYMSDCLSLMVVDGKIRQSEVLLCEDIGLRLSFTKASIDQVIEQLKGNSEVSADKIKAMVQALPHPEKI